MLASAMYHAQLRVPRPERPKGAKRIAIASRAAARRQLRARPKR
jgi:hypothetical protein